MIYWIKWNYQLMRKQTEQDARKAFFVTCLGEEKAQGKLFEHFLSTNSNHYLWINLAVFSKICLLS